MLRFAGFESVSSSSFSEAFFFLLVVEDALWVLFEVGWLDSRVGKDEVGVGAWDGVVWVESGVDESCFGDRHSASCRQSGRGIRAKATYPHETGRAATEYSISFIDRGFPPCRSPWAVSTSSRRGC